VSSSRSAVLLVAALVVSAGTSYADSGSTKRTPSSTNTPTPYTKAFTSGLLFTRTGGFAGFDDRLEIGTDGVIYCKPTIAHAFKKTLTAEETAALARLLDESDLFTTDQMFTSEGADLITYTIRYKGFTVRADEDQIPPQLSKVLDRLLQLLNEGP
jgi:hypothetical protein